MVRQGRGTFWEKENMKFRFPFPCRTLRSKVKMKTEKRAEIITFHKTVIVFCSFFHFGNHGNYGFSRSYLSRIFLAVSANSSCTDVGERILTLRSNPKIHA